VRVPVHIDHSNFVKAKTSYRYKFLNPHMNKSFGWTS